MQTKDWKSIKEPVALLIGHDPRLQTSETLAEFALFANYYFDNTIRDRNFKRKFGLASSALNQIAEISIGTIKQDEIYVTNLCNSALPHAPKGKTVYISEEKAIEGLKNIKKILLQNPTIKYIFPMSLQVNYWLQKLGLYESKNGFVEKSTPRVKGVLNHSPYYEPIKSQSFLLICGNNYDVCNSTQVVIPILHAKCYPLNFRFKAYVPAYERIIKFFSVF